jgi:hypothetical protein
MTPLKLDPGTYTVRVASNFGSLEWVTPHLAGDPGSGNVRDYDPKIRGVSVTFSPASNPNGAEEYQLALRLTSDKACGH